MLDETVVTAKGYSSMPTAQECAVFELINSSYPDSVGLLVIGSTAKRLNGIVGPAPRDLDLILLVDEISSSFARDLTLEGIVLQVDLYATTVRDFQSRLSAGDVEFCTIIRNSHVVWAQPMIREKIAELQASDLCPNASQIGKLLAFSATQKTNLLTARDLRARLTAAAQALFVSYGIDPPEPREIMQLLPRFVEKGLAPRDFPAFVYSECELTEALSRTREWVGKCTEMAALAATKRFTANTSTSPSTDIPVKAILFDLGGTLTDGTRRFDISTSSILKTLALGYKLGLVSNAPTSLRRSEFWPDWTQYFQCVLLSEDFGAAKPSPEIFGQACKELFVNANEVIFVGDNLDTDICGALNCGMKAMWIHSAVVNASQLSSRLGLASSLGDALPILEEGMKWAET